jgi:predicted dienelactone hydrolase
MVNRIRGLRHALLPLVVVVTAACGSSAPSARPAPKPRTQPAVHVRLDLVDRSRPAVDPIAVRSAPVRALPTELYLPASATARPLVVFAHGYDGDPSKFTELLQHWSDAGFAVAAPQFPISYTGAGAGPISRTGDYVNQPADLKFVLDQVLASKWASRIDADHIGAAGLSLGGMTTWGYIGNTCCRDPRIKAAIVMDGLQPSYPDGKIVPNRMPLLMYHADHDYSLPFAGARTSYANAAPPKYFVTIFGAFHAEPYENTPNVADAMVMTTSTDFWRASLLGDAAARAAIVPDATVPNVSTAEYAPKK